MPEAPQWARVRGDVNCNVRRGAWYEVVRLNPEEVVLDVNQRTVSVARSSVPAPDWQSRPANRAAPRYRT